MPTHEPESSFADPLSGRSNQNLLVFQDRMQLFKNISFLDRTARGEPCEHLYRQTPYSVACSEPKS